ncbi:hypothetical protein Tco_0615285 [Tanacetum coccineum]
MGSSSRQTSSYYLTHPTSVVDYDDEYQQDDVHNNSEDPLVSAMNSGNIGRNSRRAYVQEEVVEGMNAPKETENVQRTLRTPSSENEVTRPRKYPKLSATDVIQADYDVKATNIILQGLPPEVYALVSNHRITKEL